MNIMKECDKKEFADKYSVCANEVGNQLKKEYHHISDAYLEIGSLSGEFRISFNDRPTILSIHFNEMNQEFFNKAKEKINYFLHS